MLKIILDNFWTVLKICFFSYALETNERNHLEWEKIETDYLYTPRNKGIFTQLEVREKTMTQ